MSPGSTTRLSNGSATATPRVRQLEERIMAEQCSRVDCNRQADRVIDGKPFCSAHRFVVEGPPVVVCSISGCGCPAVASHGTRGPLCAAHIHWARAHGS